MRCAGETAAALNAEHQLALLKRQCVAQAIFHYPELNSDVSLVTGDVSLGSEDGSKAYTLAVAQQGSGELKRYEASSFAGCLSRAAEVAQEVEIYPKDLPASLPEEFRNPPADYYVGVSACMPTESMASEAASEAAKAALDRVVCGVGMRPDGAGVLKIGWGHVAVENPLFRPAAFVDCEGGGRRAFVLATAEYVGCTADGSGYHHSDTSHTWYLCMTDICVESMSGEEY